MDEPGTPDSDAVTTSAKPHEESKPHQVEDDSACIECGYKLRGLKLSADCPECGFGVGASISHLRGCAGRTIFIGGLRLIAVLTIVLLLTAGNGWLRQFLWFISGGYGDVDSVQWILIMAGGIITIATAVGLWLFSPLLARLAIPQDTNVLIKLEGRKALLQIGLALFAAWLTVTGIQGFMSSAVQYLALYEIAHESSLTYALVMLGEGFFRISIAVILIVWLSRQWNKAN
ncbi:MAG: hypothetical protein KTR15_08535 [Phycisphaeraceae bacterium]|nr:hypothetical protein [Phycisphaeraceae bacterium]